MEKDSEFVQRLSRALLQQDVQNLQQIPCKDIDTWQFRADLTLGIRSDGRRPARDQLSFSCRVLATRGGGAFSATIITDDDRYGPMKQLAKDEFDAISGAVESLGNSAEQREY